jgi:hypothetical protein
VPGYRKSCISSSPQRSIETLFTVEELGMNRARERG